MVKVSLTVRRERLWFIILVSPAIIGFLIWNVIPILASGVISLTSLRMLGDWEWVGLDNYKYLFFEDIVFYKSVRVTLYYTLVSVPLKLIVALLLAMLLNKNVAALPVFRTIYYLPSIVPTIATSILFMYVFDTDFGLLNYILNFLSINKINWLGDDRWAMPALILMSLWEVGPLMIIFLAGLQGVPRTYYEASQIDGANKLQQFFNITLPMITPTLFFNLVISIIGSIQTFVQAYIMTEGGPNNSTLFYILNLYFTAFQDFSMSLASALSWILFVFIAILSYIVFKTSKHWVYYEGK